MLLMNSSKSTLEVGIVPLEAGVPAERRGMSQGLFGTRMWASGCVLRVSHLHLALIATRRTAAGGRTALESEGLVKKSHLPLMTPWWEAACRRCQWRRLPPAGIW